MSTPEFDLELAETLLNWDTMSHGHGANAPPALRTMTVTRREALIARVRAVQSVAHAYVEARTQPGHEEGAPLSLRITETDRQVFNRLLRPSRPAHYQLGNQGGRSTVQRVEQENLNPPAHQQVVEFAHLILAALRGEQCEIMRCANPKCDTGAHKRAKLFLRPLDKRAATRYCCPECRKQAKELEEKAEAKESRRRGRPRAAAARKAASEEESAAAKPEAKPAAKASATKKAKAKGQGAATE